jgi:hypothetical protein
LHLVLDLFDSFRGHGAVGRDHSNEHDHGETVTQRCNSAVVMHVP